MVKIENKTSVFRRELDWPVVLLYLYLHVVALLSPFLIEDSLISTYLFAFLLIFLGLLGSTIGAHRLWAHKTFAADKKLRIFLMICHTLTGQGTIYNWVFDHRLHHKYLGTNSDPFNSNNNIFYLQTVSRTLKPVGGYDTLKDEIDMSDLEQDGVVMFQKRYYWILYPLLVLLLPMNAPAEYWGENLMNSFLIIGVLKYLIGCHLTSLIETSTKLYGCKNAMDDTNDKLLIDIIEKHEWATYHYLAPWDYQSGEYGFYGNDVFSGIIRVCQSLGMASSLKTLDSKTVGQAIQLSIATNKPISECLAEAQFIDVKNSRFNRSH